MEGLEKKGQLYWLGTLIGLQGTYINILLLLYYFYTLDMQIKIVNSSQFCLGFDMPE